VFDKTDNYFNLAPDEFDFLPGSHAPAWEREKIAACEMSQVLGVKSLI